ncbi:MAG: hypothetical protein QME81_17345, partial [bacterium]|nr:hypothetical protein [bacterium]
VWIFGGISLLKSGKRCQGNFNIGFSKLSPISKTVPTKSHFQNGPKSQNLQRASPGGEKRGRKENIS